MSNLAKNIKYLMERQNLNGNRLQDLTNGSITQATTSRIVTGKTKSPKDDIVEAYANFFGVSASSLRYDDLSSVQTANVANVSIGGNNTGIIGGVGNTQNNYELEQTVLPSAVADEPPAHLKDMPLLDIDDAVAFALDPTNLNNKIYATVQHISAFIPHSARTFAIKNGIDLAGIGEVLRQNDTLIFEPAIPPRNGDVVLICLDYGGANRGIVARLGVDLMGNNTIKYDDSPPTQMPKNSLICGVMTKFVHKMHDVDVLQSRLNPNYDILSTLVTE